MKGMQVFRLMVIGLKRMSAKCLFMFFLLSQVRHNIRPYFLVSDSHKRIYDVVTWAGTQVAISYTVAPFVLLAVGRSLKFYRFVCLIE